MALIQDIFGLVAGLLALILSFISIVMIQRNNRKIKELEKLVGVKKRKKHKS